MAERRGRGESAVYFEHRAGTAHKPGSERDPENALHRGCTGRWRGEVLVSNRAGRRVRKQVSATTKTELYRRLKDLKDGGCAPSRLGSSPESGNSEDLELRRALDPGSAHGLAQGRVVGEAARLFCAGEVVGDKQLVAVIIQPHYPL